VSIDQIGCRETHLFAPANIVSRSLMASLPSRFASLVTRSRLAPANNARRAASATFDSILEWYQEWRAQMREAHAGYTTH